MRLRSPLLACLIVVLDDDRRIDERRAGGGRLRMRHPVVRDASSKSLEQNQIPKHHILSSSLSSPRLSSSLLTLSTMGTPPTSAATRDLI
jgi:hypothetical protein